MIEYLKNLLKYWLGPAIAVAALINGWWAWSDVQVKNAQIVELQKQTISLSQYLSGQCKQLLESKDFVVKSKAELEAEAKAKAEAVAEAMAELDAEKNK